MNKAIYKSIYCFLLANFLMLFGQGSNDLYKSVRKNQSLINNVYRQVITNYVDEIDLTEIDLLLLPRMNYT